MLRGLWKLTWLEIKIFVREPLGVDRHGRRFRCWCSSSSAGCSAGAAAPVLAARRAFVTVDLPILVSILMALSAVLSLVTIMSIYREGGILKRLRATPLRPHTILTAHVLVKLLFTAITLAAMVLAGRRYLPGGIDAPLVSFAAGAAVQHVEHRLDGVPDRQRGSNRAVRAADRYGDPVSDARSLRAVRADPRAAADRCKAWRVPCR